jgi:signal transduction histidine kinase
MPRFSIKYLNLFTIPGRVFWGVFLIILSVLSLFWFWFYHRVYSSLDREAENRLVKMTRAMAAELDTDNNQSSGFLEAEQRFEAGARVLKKLWRFENSRNWIQNLYWLDVSGKKPEFIASFSAECKTNTALLPPTAEEAEDMVFAYINELEKGRVVLPDPFSFGASRRFKIALFPMLDSDLMLESVVGIEADMQYLGLFDQLNNFIGEMLIFSLIFSLVTALLVARSSSKKTELLLSRLKQIEKGSIPHFDNLGLEELNCLQKGIIDLAQANLEKDVHLRALFARKLDELAFTGGALAHEIRNPLSAIEMHFGLLHRRLKKENLSEGNEVNEIYEQLKQLRLLVESFLNYTRKVEPQKEIIDLESFFDSIIKTKTSVNKNLVWEYQSEEKIKINFDKAMLLQICENLVNNAVEAGKKNSVRIKTKACVKSEMCQIQFINNGPLIPESILKQLFTPFVSSKPQGNGIGLALIRKLVEAHNGEIYCENLDDAVAFYLEVPFK